GNRKPWQALELLDSAAQRIDFEDGSFFIDGDAINQKFLFLGDCSIRDDLGDKTYLENMLKTALIKKKLFTLPRDQKEIDDYIGSIYRQAFLSRVSLTGHVHPFLNLHKAV